MIDELTMKICTYEKAKLGGNMRWGKGLPTARENF